MIDSTYRQVQASTEPIPGELFYIKTIFNTYNNFNDINLLLAFKATADLDTLYYHQAMRQPDRDDFKAAMNKEIKDQMNNGNFIVLHKKSLSPGTLIISTV